MDIEELRKSIVAMPKPRTNRRVFTKEELDLIIEYWPIRQHNEMAKAFGVCSNILLRIYRAEREKRDAKK